MSQHDMDILNGAGLAVRTDLNLALKALASQSLGATAPTTTFPGQMWADTGTARLKQRDSANTKWLDRGALDVDRAPFGGYAGFSTTSTNTTLAAANLGQVLYVTAAGTTQTLPPIASAPAGSAIAFAAFGATTVKGNAAELITNIYGTASSNTIQIGGGERLQLTSNGSSWNISSYERAEAGAPIGTASNAKMSVASATAITSIVADEVVVGAALGGQSYRLSGFNNAINLGITGAAGMDTGLAPASGFVAVYAIFNPTTGISRLLAVDATSVVAPTIYAGANMPSGFTASALIAVWPTNASRQFVAGIMQGRQVAIAGVQVLSSSVQQASFVSLSLTAAVPPNAKTAKGYMRVGSSSQANNLGQISSNSIGMDTTIIEGGYTNATSAFTVAMLTQQTMYYTATTSAGTLVNLIVISSYTF